jgi:hypothetical protein
MSIAGRCAAGSARSAPESVLNAAAATGELCEILETIWGTRSPRAGFVGEDQPRTCAAMLGTILLIILILLLIGALPTWGYSGGWGYYPSGGIGLLLVIVIILLVVGRI